MIENGCFGRKATALAQSLDFSVVRLQPQTTEPIRCAGTGRQLVVALAGVNIVRLESLFFGRLSQVVARLAPFAVMNEPLVADMVIWQPYTSVCFFVLTASSKGLKRSSTLCSL